MATTGRVIEGTFELPFGGSITVSRHCSHQGAVAASERVGRQCVELLGAYATQGPLTDAEAAKHLGIERSTINARRAELIRRLLVAKHGTKRNPETGITNTTWGLIGGK